MRKRTAKARDGFVTEAERREALRLKAEACAASFRRTGVVLPVYDTREVLGSVIARGLCTWEELRAAGADVPPLARGTAAMKAEG